MATCQCHMGLRQGLYSSFHRKAMQALGSDTACNVLYQDPRHKMTSSRRFLYGVSQSYASVVSSTLQIVVL